MRKFLFSLLISLSVATMMGQVTTNPLFITQSGCPFEITFDASAGSAGLKNVTSGVYAHIGVITSASSSSSDWKYVLTPWPNGTNSATANLSKNALTYIGNNIWKMTISPDIQTWLGVPSTEIIKKIALVFRNADGSKTGKTSTGGDIFVDVYQSGLNVAFVKPAADGFSSVGTTMPIKIASSVSSQLHLSVNATSLKTNADSTSLTTSYTFSTPGDYQFVANATTSGVTVSDTLNICVPSSVVSQTRPTGVGNGINYIDDNTVTLVLHAPGKSNVFVVGDMNNWMLSNSYQMKQDGDYWWITLTGLTAGKMYAFQYVVDGTIRVSDPYAELVLDPWNDTYISSSIFPGLKPYPTGKTSGIVATFQTARTPYTWNVSGFSIPSKDNLMIYELLLRDFTAEKSLQSAIARLDYLKELGINAVELMPVQEFDGNDSWGYNPSHFFAPDKAYGTPDMYKKFVDECHSRGLAVILDMVFNHATGNCPFAGLYWNSTSGQPASNNPWMNVTAPHKYSVFNDFNHESTYTRAYFKRVLQYWLTEYKVDGYRMDLAKGFTQYGTADSYDATRIAILKDYYNTVVATNPNAIFILEHLGNSAEQLELANAGMYLWAKNTDNYAQAAMGYSSGSDFGGMVSTPRKWVGYAESHDELRNFYKVKMYGAGTLTSDSLARVARVPLVMAFNALLPGPKMFWEFEELGFDYTGGNGDTSSKPSAWSWLNLTHRKAAYDACCKILSLRNKYSDAFSNGTLSTNISTNDWSNGRRISISSGDINLIALGNFDVSNTVTVYPNFPKAGNWYNILTGEVLNVSNTSMSLQLAPGKLLLYTDRLVSATKELSSAASCKVYPSVVEDRLNVESDYAVQEINVYNLLGRLMYSQSNQQAINTSTWPSGIYLVEVLGSQNKHVFKIIKQ